MPTGRRPNVRILGEGRTTDRVSINGFEIVEDDATSVVLRNDDRVITDRDADDTASDLRANIR